MRHKDEMKKARGWRKAMAFLVTLVLVCGLVMPAYASEAAEEKAEVKTEVKAEVKTEVKCTCDTKTEEHTAECAITKAKLEKAASEESAEKTEEPADQAGDTTVTVEQKTEAKEKVAVIPEEKPEATNLEQDGQGDSKETDQDTTKQEHTEVIDGEPEASLFDTYKAQLDAQKQLFDNGEQDLDTLNDNVYEIMDAFGTSFDDGELTDDEYNGLVGYATEVLDLATEQDTYKISGDSTVEVGKTISLSSGKGNSNHSWTSSDESKATVSGAGRQATVTGVSAGKVTIRHTYGYSGNYDEKEITVTSAETVTPAASEGDTSRIYMYVHIEADEGVDLTGWKLNDKGWYTIGYVDVPTSSLDFGSPTSSNGEWIYKVDPNFNVIKSAIANKFTPYDGNPVEPADIVKYTDWTAFKDCDGANDYVYSGTRALHFDGVLRITKADVVHQLVYDKNAGNDNVKNMPPAGMIVNKEQTADFTVDSKVPVREGYTFTGWNTKADGSGDAYAAGDTITVEKTATLYAQWVRALTELTVTKNVTGRLGDKTKDFSFTVTVSDNATFEIVKDGVTTSCTGTATFTLHDTQSVILNKVPIGATVTVTESDYGEGKGGYTTSYIVNGGEKTTGREASVTANNNDSIAFTNLKDTKPDTGVLLDSLPYVLILVAVVAGVALTLVRKRGNRFED